MNGRRSAGKKGGNHLPAELVIAQIVLPRQKSEVLRLDHGEPVPHSGADGAVALEAAFIEIEVRLVADDAAVTPASVGFFHVRPPLGQKSAKELFLTIRPCRSPAINGTFLPRSGVPGMDSPFGREGKSDASPTERSIIP
jgi:hypothetical protein